MYKRSCSCVSKTDAVAVCRILGLQQCSWVGEIVLPLLHTPTPMPLPPRSPPTPFDPLNSHEACIEVGKPSSAFGTARLAHDCHKSDVFGVSHCGCDASDLAHCAQLADALDFSEHPHMFYEGHWQPLIVHQVSVFCELSGAPPRAAAGAVGMVSIRRWASTSDMCMRMQALVC